MTTPDLINDEPDYDRAETRCRWCRAPIHRFPTGWAHVVECLERPLESLSWRSCWAPDENPLTDPRRTADPEEIA